MKQIIQNLILFAPQTLQHDFANYNTFLNKLNVEEFVVYGPATQNMPFIVQVKPYEELIELDKQMEEEPQEVVETAEPEEPEVISYEEPAIIDVEPEEPTITEPEEEPEVVEFTEAPEFESESEDVELPPFQDEQSFLSDIDETSTFEQEALEDRETLEEQVAKDVDAALYRKFEEESLETENDVNPEILLDEEEPELSDSDLDFIQSMPMEDNTQEVYSSEEFLQEEEQPSVEELEASVLDEGAIEELEVDSTPDFIDEDADDESQIVPIYTPEEINESNDAPLFESGDVVTHPKYGQGVVEKMINYGNKTLCSISFVNIGRRLLDPNLSELTLVSRDGVIVS